VLLEIKVLS